MIAGLWGEEALRSEQPLSATLKDGVWHVVGTFPPLPASGILYGGPAELYISQQDGRILSVHKNE